MNNLTEIGKAALKFFVESIQSGSLDEEFNIVWSISGPIVRFRSGYRKAPPLTRVTLDGLQEAGLILWRDSGTRTGSVACTIKPKAFEVVKNNFVKPITVDMSNEPTEIRDSLKSFRDKYPDPSKVAFIIMRFGATPAHEKIVVGIKAALMKHGITALRADDFEFHSNLFLNILTYIYGCGFGVAFFERIQTDDPNPNVALEVGYMLALRKNVCLFKDRTLKELPTDLISHLYRNFDQLDPENSIPDPLEKWLVSYGIIESTRVPTETEALRIEISTLKELMEASNLICPKCKSPLLHRNFRLVSCSIRDKDYDAEIEYREYACGSLYEESTEISPCRSHTS